MIICIIFFGSAGTVLAQTHVQTNTLFQVSAATTIASTFAAPSTSGNLIVVHLDWDNQARSVTSVTDNKGKQLCQDQRTDQLAWCVNYRAELWYAYNIIGGGGAIKVTRNTFRCTNKFYPDLYQRIFRNPFRSKPFGSKCGGHWKWKPLSAVETKPPPIIMN